MNKNEFMEELKKLNIEINDEKYSKFEKYYEFLIEYNKKVNLTSITTKEEVFLKHFYDSLTLVKAIDFNKIQNMCDFGTGAGFPGVVLKIIYDDINTTLIESSKKKSVFLNELIKYLGLKNIRVENVRVEEYKKGKFDFVTCRAVSKLSVILEICSDIVKKDGLFVPMKGDTEELKNMKNINKIGFGYIDRIEFKLPVEKSKRSLIIFKKIKECEKGYPRPYKKIISNPLF